MKKPARFPVDRLLTGLIVVLPALYFIWVLVPFNEAIEVNDRVGLSEDQTELLIELAHEIGAYNVVPPEELKKDARWTPWSRPRLFITIEGTTSAVRVLAGFQGGPRNGSGRYFHATWTGASWEIRERTISLWKASDMIFFQQPVP